MAVEAVEDGAHVFEHVATVFAPLVVGVAHVVHHALLHVDAAVVLTYTFEFGQVVSPPPNPPPQIHSNTHLLLQLPYRLGFPLLLKSHIYQTDSSQFLRLLY